MDKLIDLKNFFLEEFEKIELESVTNENIEEFFKIIENSSSNYQLFHREDKNAEEYLYFLEEKEKIVVITIDYEEKKLVSEMKIFKRFKE